MLETFHIYDGDNNKCIYIGHNYVNHFSHGYIRTLLYKISYISEEWTQKHLFRRHYCMNGYFIGYCNSTGQQM